MAKRASCQPKDETGPLKKETPAARRQPPAKRHKVENSEQRQTIGDMFKRSADATPATATTLSSSAGEPGGHAPPIKSQAQESDNDFEREIEDALAELSTSQAIPTATGSGAVEHESVEELGQHGSAEIAEVGLDHFGSLECVDIEQVVVGRVYWTHVHDNTEHAPKDFSTSSAEAYTVQVDSINAVARTVIVHNTDDEELIETLDIEDLRVNRTLAEPPRRRELRGGISSLSCFTNDDAASEIDDGEEQALEAIGGEGAKDMSADAGRGVQDEQKETRPQATIDDDGHELGHVGTDRALVPPKILWLLLVSVCI